MKDFIHGMRRDATRSSACTSTRTVQYEYQQCLEERTVRDLETYNKE